MDIGCYCPIIINTEIWLVCTISISISDYSYSLLNSQCIGEYITMKLFLPASNIL